MYDIDLAAVFAMEREAFNTPEARFRREYEELQEVARARTKLAAARARLDRIVAARLAN